ncbi:hypothetical protein AB0K00_20330 [Dactylosporangium sp. NPDC049525]|uniref:hypothetical protein n=1 Tax=Dactylosporangium sp. NPDC049525 TaxID=3154730 RepID=UPI0034213940
MSLTWWSIEVRDGETPARQWRDAWSESLLEAAVTHGARDFIWQAEPFGVVLELGFAETGDWDRFRHLPAVVAAIDAVDPTALYVYPGRGGSAGAGLPRRTPRPIVEDAAPLPVSPAPLLVAMLS